MALDAFWVIGHFGNNINNVFETCISHSIFNRKHKQSHTQHFNGVLFATTLQLLTLNLVRLSDNVMKISPRESIAGLELRSVPYSRTQHFADMRIRGRANLQTRHFADMPVHRLWTICRKTFRGQVELFVEKLKSPLYQHYANPAKQQQRCECCVDCQPYCMLLLGQPQCAAPCRKCVHQSCRCRALYTSLITCRKCKNFVFCVLSKYLQWMQYLAKYESYCESVKAWKQVIIKWESMWKHLNPKPQTRNPIPNLKPYA